MKIEQFQMERMQSTWENIVRFNLSESGVHPLAIGELLSDPSEREEFFGLELGYSQSNGTPELRRAISALYEGSSKDNVTVTIGTAEANFLASWMLTEPGDEVIMMLPNYMQLWGLFRSFGAEVRPLHLVEERSWSPDFDELRSAISPRTKVIAVCNPNNPTGAILSDAEIDVIIDAARSAGAWILADEVYRGAELSGEISTGFWGRYEKLIVTSGLSKAYGLPGLRIGWIVSTEEFAARAWAYHDYTTIGPSPASDYLARVALRPETRRGLLDRTRRILNANYPVLRQWVDSRGGQFSITDPKAGAIGYLKQNLGVESLAFVERLRKQKSVLIVPGEHFIMPGFLRIGFGSNQDYLRGGLSLIEELIAEIQ